MRNVISKMGQLILVCMLLMSVSSCSKSKLAIAAAAANAECPEQIEEGLTMTEVKLEDGDLVYVIELDETVGTINELKLGAAFLRPVMAAQLTAKNDPDIVELINLVKEAKADIVYRFIGSQSENQFDMTFSHSEL